MQTDRQNLSFSVGVFNFGDQCISQLTRLKSHVVVATSKASTELETLHLSQAEGSLGEHDQAIIQARDDREPWSETHSAGIHLMHRLVVQTGALHRRDVSLGHFRKGVDFLKKHDVGLNKRELPKLEVEPRLPDLLRFARPDRHPAWLKSVQRVVCQQRDL